MVEFLLEHKADIEAKNENGDTPLLAASLGRHHDAVPVLLEHGASVEAIADKIPMIKNPMVEEMLEQADDPILDNDPILDIKHKEAFDAIKHRMEMRFAKTLDLTTLAKELLSEEHNYPISSDDNDKTDEIKAFAAKHEVVAPSASAAPKRKVPATAMMRKIRAAKGKE